MGLVGLARRLPPNSPAITSGRTWCPRAASAPCGTIPNGTRGACRGAAGIPLGRQGHVDEIAATCLFLVSDEGGFITGQTIHVNGGTGYY
jgi:NAD(P)-dependent dehydrogenase (short-subunit alcohol dehydrogenase family)